jgi:hypothetical protein
MIKLINYLHQVFILEFLSLTQDKENNMTMFRLV